MGLAQQWDQLDQLGMRMQHNLEQQIQARCPGRGRAGHAASRLGRRTRPRPRPSFQEHDRSDRGGLKEFSMMFMSIPRALPAGEGGLSSRASELRHRLSATDTSTRTSPGRLNHQEFKSCLLPGL